MLTEGQWNQKSDTSDGPLADVVDVPFASISLRVLQFRLRHDLDHAPVEV